MRNLLVVIVGPRDLGKREFAEALESYLIKELHTTALYVSGTSHEALKAHAEELHKNNDTQIVISTQNYIKPHAEDNDLSKFEKDREKFGEPDVWIKMSANWEGLFETRNNKGIKNKFYSRNSPKEPDPYTIEYLAGYVAKFEYINVPLSKNSLACPQR